MAAIEGLVTANQLAPQPQQQQQQQQQPQQAIVLERLNDAVQQQLNLESVKTRALSLHKAISRILEDLDVFARTNTSPKWSLSLTLFNFPNFEFFRIEFEFDRFCTEFCFELIGKIFWGNIRWWIWSFSTLSTKFGRFPRRLWCIPRMSMPKILQVWFFFFFFNFTHN